jgi:tRNA(Arg) A34 adenosine deaminase TadA
MERAVAMRQLAIAAGDQPFGAIIAKGDQIVGVGPSQVVVNGDPTAHAEMEAIRDACRRLGTRDLSGCVLYATSRPCRMCEAASVWANMARLYYGDQITDGGPPRLSAC